MKGRVKVIIVAVRIMNATISENDKNQIKQYLLGQLAEADEEVVELRLMSDQAFSEEFDIVVDEIASLYVSGHFTGEEKTQVEQYFLRSPQRRLKVQFICELLRQVNTSAVPASAPQGLWQRVTTFFGQPSTFRPAISFAILLIVAGLVFWGISNRLNPTYQSFELAMTTAERSAGTPITRVHLAAGVDALRIKLKLPTLTAPQYRASLRGEKVSLPQLPVEAQDSDSITVTVPADQIDRGSTYAIELTEINNGRETPLRGAYEFKVEVD